MPAYFFDTTAVIDYYYSNRDIKKQILDLIKDSPSIYISKYVLAELSRGFIYNLIVFYNRSKLYYKYHELRDYIDRNFRKQRFQATINRFISIYFQEIENNGEIHDPNKLDLFKGRLRYFIRRGWESIIKDVEEIINNIGCAEDLSGPIFTQDGIFDIKPKRSCGNINKCKLKEYIQKNYEDFLKLHRLLSSFENPDKETIGRRSSLKQLLKHPDIDFDIKHCIKLGDAIIVHECPGNCTIITKNKIHFEPICGIFNKNAIYYP